MATLEQLVSEHTELSAAATEHLSQLVSEWTLLADLSFSDLLLWVPKWHDGGYVCVAQIRPVTAATRIDSDVVGTFQSERRLLAVDRAYLNKEIIELDEVIAIPIVLDKKCIAVIERYRGVREEGSLVSAYSAAANKLFEMVKTGSFPPVTNTSMITSLPRVGDGVLLLDDQGVVQFASPNATSAFRRLGFASDIVKTHLASTTTSLIKRLGVIDESLTLVASGSKAGAIEIENQSATITLRSYPFVSDGKSSGALILVRDVTELRRRERALLTKEAALREAHHRVKNNLQTVAALLRMQARRSSIEAKRALVEAERRIEVIALVHETLTLAPAESVDFTEIADRLIALTKQLAPNTIEISRTGDFGHLSAEQAVALAAALSELLQNAIEHGDTNKPIALSVQSSNPLEFQIVNFSVTRGVHAEGLGISIVRSLVEGELAGEVKISTSNGRFIVEVSMHK